MHRVVRFDYRTASGATPSLASSNPGGVVAARGQWYVVGHDVDRDATRAFRLSRIVGKCQSQRPPVSYDIPTDVDLRELVLSAFPVTPTAEVVARLAPGRAARLRHLATSTDGDIAAFADSDPSAMLVNCSSWTRCRSARSPQRFATKSGSASTVCPGAKPRELTDHERAALKAAEAKAHNGPSSSRPRNNSRSPPRARSMARAHPRGDVRTGSSALPGVDVARLHKDLELAVCTEFGSNLLTLDIDAWGTIHVRDPQNHGAPSVHGGRGFSLLVGLDLLAQIPWPPRSFGSCFRERQAKKPSATWRTHRSTHC